MPHVADAPSSSVLDAENPHAGQGPVMLDIGGDVGALVVTMPADMAGIEVEIRPRDAAGPDAGSHDHDDHDESHHDQSHDDQSHDDQSHHQPHHDPHPHAHGEGEHLVHVAVVGRPANGRVIHSAVFADLRQGDYELSPRPFGSVYLTVTVTGGEVALAQWPA